MGNMKNKDKYSLDKLTITVTYTAIGTAEVKVSDGLNCIFCRYYNAEEFTPQWTIDFAKWLEKKYYPTILTEKEKAYLSAVIKPFRKRIKYIRKIDHSSVNNDQFICIVLAGDRCGLPNFKTGTMYKGMEVDKDYTLEELGL